MHTRRLIKKGPEVLGNQRTKWPNTAPQGVLFCFTLDAIRRNPPLPRPEVAKFNFYIANRGHTTATTGEGESGPRGKIKNKGNPGRRRGVTHTRERHACPSPQHTDINVAILRDIKKKSSGLAYRSISNLKTPSSYYTLIGVRELLGRPRTPDDIVSRATMKT